MRRARAASLGVLLACSSCSYLYEVELHVTLADGVVLPAGAMIEWVIAEHGQAPETTAPTATAITIVDGQRTYEAKRTVCCAPEPKVSVMAFVDRDRDRVLDADEPRGVDSGNPVTLHDTVNAYESVITIAAAPGK